MRLAILSNRNKLHKELQQVKDMICIGPFFNSGKILRQWYVEYSLDPLQISDSGDGKGQFPKDCINSQF